MWLTRISVKYPVFTIMMMLSFLVLGIASWQRMHIEEFPDIDFPFVVVHTTYAGASPEVVESEISKKIEDQINTISGLKQIISTSSQGLSTVIAEFNLDVDSAVAAQDIRDKIAPVSAQFRDDIDEPIIERYNPQATPVMSVVVESSRLDLKQLSDFVDQRMLPQLRTVAGVGRVDVLGQTKRQIRINIQPMKLQSYGVGINEVISALKNENVQIPAGTLTNSQRDFVVEIQGKIRNLKDFNQLIVANRAGVAIHLGQVADIIDDQEEAESSAIFNGKTALSIDILRNSDANIIQVVDALNSRFQQLDQQLPEGTKLSIVTDASQGIRGSIKDVSRTIIEGAILAVVIVLLFLGSIRSTIITGLTLPISLLGTLTVIWALGFSINMMTLLALSLSIGLLIDDAIVVRENIVRHAELGKDHVTAALDGTKEIGLAVLATTLTIVAVFLPVAFMDGIIGRFFYQFGVTVSVAVLLSMFVSFTLDPMLSAHWAEKNKQQQNPNRLQRFFHWTSHQLDRLNHVYEKALSWALRFRLLTLAIAIISLLAALGLSNLIGTEFVPVADKGAIRVKFETTEDASLHYTAAKVKQVQAILKQMPNIQDSYAVINSTNYQGKNHASLYVQLTPRHERTQSLQEISNQIRQRLLYVAGITLSSVASADETVSGGMKPIMISIKGPDLDELQKISDRLMQEMHAIKGLVDLESSLGKPRPTLSLEIDRQLANALGLSVNQIATSLRALIAGDNVTSWEDEQGENYDVNVRLAAKDRVSPADLNALYFNGTTPTSSDIGLIPISAVANMQQTMSASQINRRDLTREILIEANTSGRPAGDIGQDIEKLQQNFKLPAGYSFSTQGANADMAESAGYALVAIGLSIIFIYIVLGSQFNSFIHPAAIMASLPLSLIGVFLALFLFRSTLNLFSIIGIIMLMGLVTKNAILLIDFIKKAMEQGISRQDAILQAGKNRLRPILMTSSAMVMGMVPLALGLGDSGEQSAPMAHAVIGGVITSTLLTLIVVPVVFTYLDDFKNFGLRLMRKVLS
ncbi:efflux RND transporter permease subunit [Acinetobacter qingfengensis]|uniref:Nodulation protein NolG n=1 Tax=Acinetobacter qingfengensis TaxID=1262585 RepID=A0A1E7RFH7_9GAMM|nr:efflux RND transporter permease subunit [Acinetobacter qingfengensis]KAA8731865.1 efflux RND transporter permease subunit [Acinetobacter qingfengensis]OEY98012.1 nodulation protein NolG [Acinetobacter qingfengensis]